MLSTSISTSTTTSFRMAIQERRLRRLERSTPHHSDVGRSKRKKYFVTRRNMLSSSGGNRNLTCTRLLRLSLLSVHIDKP